MEKLGFLFPKWRHGNSCMNREAQGDPGDGETQVLQMLAPCWGWGGGRSSQDLTTPPVKLTYSLCLSRVLPLSDWQEKLGQVGPLTGFTGLSCSHAHPPGKGPSGHMVATSCWALLGPAGPCSSWEWLPGHGTLRTFSSAFLKNLGRSLHVP